MVVLPKCVTASDLVQNPILPWVKELSVSVGMTCLPSRKQLIRLPWHWIPISCQPPAGMLSSAPMGTLRWPLTNL